MRRLLFVCAVSAVVLYAAWSLFTFGALLFAKPHATRHRSVVPDAEAAAVVTEVAPLPTPSAVVKPGQDKAIALVWRGQYDMAVEPPTIQWVEGDKLDCGTGRAANGKLVGGHWGNGFHGWIEPAAGVWPPCVYGVFDPEAYAIRLSWPRGTTRFSTTALAHELAHARTWVNEHDISYSHSGIDFAPRGRVARADAALAAQGL